MKFWKALLNCIMIIFLLFGCVLTVPKILGIKPMMVLSGSMEPYIKTGSIVYTNTNDINPEIGDVITYRIMDEHVTHRVIDMDGEYYITKGDNNDGTDVEPVSLSQISGKVVFSIPYIGYAANWIQTKQGMAFVFIFFTIMMIIDNTSDNIHINCSKKRNTNRNSKELKIRSY